MYICVLLMNTFAVKNKRKWHWARTVGLLPLIGFDTLNYYTYSRMIVTENINENYLFPSPSQWTTVQVSG